MNAAPQIAVLLTCHNRRAETLACLDAVAAQQTDAELTVFLVDAGSSDGTSDAVSERYPDTRIIPAGPELFWNGGMRVAWDAALDAGFDDVLWLNDDTWLDPHAVQHLLDTRADRNDPVIVAGATRDPADDTKITYSGVERRDTNRPLKFSLVAPSDQAQPVETMNGNCVLVPTAIVERIGTLEPRFTHGMGDFDYGLRAAKAGFSILLAAGTIGTCAQNDKVTEELRGTWKRLQSEKGLPPREWAEFARRWAGPRWPIYFASPYVRRMIRSARGKPNP